MDPQAEKKEEILPQIEQGIVDAHAAAIKENYELLRMKFDDLMPPEKLTSADWRAIATGVIDGRTIPLKKADGSPQIVSFAQADTIIGDIPAAQAMIKSRGANVFSDLLMTREDVKLVADAAARGVANNYVDENKKSATLFTMVKHLKAAYENDGILGVLDTNRRNNAAAGNVRASVVANLQTLAANNPRIGRIIGDGTNSTDIINSLADEIQAQTKNTLSGAAPDKADKLDKVTTRKIDDAIRGMVKDEIHSQVSTATNDAITAKREEELEKIRSGNAFGGGIIGAIISGLFALLEAFGMEKTVAGWFGQSIPEDKQITAVANATADSVSTALTSPDFTYKGKNISQLKKAPKELQAAIQSNVYSTLQEKRAEFGNFSDGQLAEIASKAGAKVAEDPSKILNLNNEDPAKKVAANIAPGTVAPSLRQDTSRSHAETIQVGTGGTAQPAQMAAR